MLEAAMGFHETIIARTRLKSTRETRLGWSAWPLFD